MISEEKSRVLYEFLNNWPLEKIRSMKYEEYTGLEDMSTFCYSVEHGTLKLGTIRGYPSSKFGFFRWGKSFNEESERSMHDAKYAWDKKLGNSRKDAFAVLIGKICEVIEAAKICDLETIENSTLHAWYKWKLASLYSEGRIPPIFKMAVIDKIAQEYGIEKKRAPVLEHIMNGVPESECRFKFVFDLFRQFDIADQETPKPSQLKNENAKVIFIKKSSYTAEMRHNIIQNKLYTLLQKEYPNDKIELEKNYIDIYRESDNEIYFYEVKSSYSPSFCAREALGQALHYASISNSSKKKNIIIVGERPPLDSDISYFEFIKKNIKLRFEYINVEIP